MTTPAIAAGAAQQAEAQTPRHDGPKTIALTSHSVSVCTRFFSFDYTWTEQENTARESDAPLTRASNSPAQTQETTQPKTQPRPRRHESFQAVLRRRQLANLLAPVSVPPRDRMVVEEPLGPLGSPQPARVCSSYDRQESPTASSTRKTYTA